MSKHLVKVEETYRADTEAEAAQIINDAKHDNHFELVKYSSVKRDKKQKGEIVDEWTRVTLTKQFDDEKEPLNEVSVSYDVQEGFAVE